VEVAFSRKAAGMESQSVVIPADLLGAEAQLDNTARARRCNPHCRAPRAGDLAHFTSQEATSWAARCAVDTRYGTISERPARSHRHALLEYGIGRSVSSAPWPVGEGAGRSEIVPVLVSTRIVPPSTLLLRREY